MKAGIGQYLEDVRVHLHLDPRTEQRVISELSTHFEEKVADLEEQGATKERAEQTALDSFGDSRQIARLMYEAYSRGSWTEALISCQPHLIVAALFATHVWRSPILLGMAFAAIIAIAILGWRNGASNWLYSWLGYALLPLLVVGYVSIDPVARTVTYLVSGQGTPASFWHMAVLVLLYAFTLWLICAIAVNIARRDWILLSLMILPLPVLVVWLINETQLVGFLPQALVSIETRFSMWDGAMAMFFVFLGVLTAAFVRARLRAVKVGAVVIVGIIGSALAARSIWVDVGFLRLVLITLGLFLFLTIPLLLHNVLGHGQGPDEPLPS
ncbi:MAG TPA: permease prefix domain 1-containing protein [Spirochaetia bacterium]